MGRLLNELFKSNRVQNVDGTPASMSDAERTEAITDLCQFVEWEANDLKQIYGEKAAVYCSVNTDDAFAAMLALWRERRVKQSRESVSATARQACNLIDSLTS